MEPTAVALALEAPIATAIESLRRAVAGPQSFDPASAEGVVRLAALDAELVTLVPELIRTLSAGAPGMRIIARATGRQNALDAIAAGELDVALGYFRDLSDAFIKDDLFQEDFLVVGNRSKHLPALAAVQTTNALATVPRGIAMRYARAFHLAVAEPPLAIRNFSIAAVRHRRDEHNPMHRWLLERLREASNKGARFLEQSNNLCVARCNFTIMASQPRLSVHPEVLQSECLLRDGLELRFC